MGQTITADVANTTPTLNGRGLEDLPAGDILTISFINPKSSRTKGVNGGIVIKKRIDGEVANITFRLMKYSADDAFMQNAINQNDVEVFNGSIKTNFTRDGVDGVETYNVSNGIVTNVSDVTINNQDGEDVVEYVIEADVVRSV